jgi:hypothetical protein
MLTYATYADAYTQDEQLEASRVRIDGLESVAEGLKHQALSLLALLVQKYTY